MFCWENIKHSWTFWGRSGNENETDDNENNLINLIDLPKGKIKKGVFLPNSVQDWESANEFSRMNIHRNANIEDLNSEIRDTKNDDDNDDDDDGDD